MPSKNTVREWDVPAYYHIYNRGANGATIFSNSQDKQKFLSLIERYITLQEDREDSERDYPYYPVEVIAYCLMGNHFHLFLYQEDDPWAISGLLRSVSTSYTMYRNKKYKTHGHLFQSVFKASRVRDEEYFKHITRYIHMNPRTYKTYRWSSLRAYLGGESELAVNSYRVNDMTTSGYMKFLEEYESKKAELELLKEQLAK